LALLGKEWGVENALGVWAIILPVQEKGYIRQKNTITILLNFDSGSLVIKIT